MALTEIYVDPSINADSGAGTVGDPYGDLEYAIEQETFDTTNGTRVNIKSGATETLAAGLQTAMADTVTSIAWAPSNAAHLVFQGYTSTAGDGGVGIIDGNSASIFSDINQDFMHFKDLEMKNSGSVQLILFDNECSVVNCELHGTTNTAIEAGEQLICIGNYIYDVGNRGISVGIDGGYIGYNYIDGSLGTNKLSASSNSGIKATTGYTIDRNVVIVQGAADGILFDSGTQAVTNNSIYCADAGTGFGIDSQDATSGVSCLIANNIVEGFSGSGGVGVNFVPANAVVFIGNSAYDCETAFSGPAGTILLEGGNETLVASPFTDPANGDFSPVDTGSVKEGSLPAIIGGGLV